MPAGDVLRDIRSQNYGLEKPPKSAASDEPDHDPDEPNQTSRIIKLTEEESKDLEEQAIRPGEEAVFEVRGNLEGDHLHVMSVQYAKENKRLVSQPDEVEEMVKKMGILVRPKREISPSG